MRFFENLSVFTIFYISAQNANLIAFCALIFLTQNQTKLLK